MRCLVTGASGHLGSHLTELLVREGAEVTVLCREESDLWRLKDVLDRVRVLRRARAAEIKRAAPEAVFHLAWQGVAGDAHDAPEQLTVNVAATLELCQIVVESGCRVFVGLGSQAEYGPHDAVLTEETLARPATAYGVAKLCAGVMTAKLCELAGVRHAWLRLLATYGPKDDERHLIPAVIRSLLKGERPRLTAGEQLWDYLYVEDAARAVLGVAANTGARGVFNLGSGRAATVRSIVERLRDLIDPSAEPGFGEVPYAPGQLMRLETSIERLRRATGWEPRVGLDEGLGRTVEWYKAQVGSSS
jgi:nucleoside-diphosphate-sugar epimerase